MKTVVPAGKAVQIIVRPVQPGNSWPSGDYELVVYVEAETGKERALGHIREALNNYEFAPEEAVRLANK